jgi:hypothetical protein
MNTDRIEVIQKETAYPDSISVQQALLKVWNETAYENKRLNSELASAAILKDCGWTLLQTQPEIWTPDCLASRGKTTGTPEGKFCPFCGGRVGLWDVPEVI